MFTKEDLSLFQAKGISTHQAEEQLRTFSQGFPFLDILCAATPTRGILRLSENDKQAYVEAWLSYLKTDKKVFKFVPASGAASRMFKNLFEFLEAPYEAPDTEFEKKFFAQIHDFAFFSDLETVCQLKEGKSVDELLRLGKYKTVLQRLLLSDGLNYGNLSKGLLKFHRYAQSGRTPFEEHIIEAGLYAQNHQGDINLHFTVSPEHRHLFLELKEQVVSELSSRSKQKYSIDFSVQKSKTDTLAADANNNPFRDENGTILFRPGGHGALIENLNEIDADVIFIKNIDNVVPDSCKAQEVKYKQMLAGVLVSLQRKAFRYLQLLQESTYTEAQWAEILDFVQNTLNIDFSDTSMSSERLKEFVANKLNRPFRVCGMVKNTDEPGGGPFIARNSDGTYSPQILESSQIDMSDGVKKEMFQKGTHFNPVDIVCGVKNYQGNKFDLTSFVDPKTGFISHKSKNGRELKALELPGLWNGAMSDWNTIFVEVPIETFNPVKTVNDLLRPQHRS